MKKLVAFWLAFILVLCSICSVAATIDTQTGRLFGDTDNDGFVAITDATKIQKHVARILVLDEETLKIADVDGDNQITIMDCTSIQQLIAKIIDTFPVEKETTIPSEFSTGSGLIQGDNPTESQKPTETQTEEPTKPEKDGPSEYELEILRLVNIEREKEGLEPLEFAYFIYDCAVIRAKECAPMDDCSHTRPDGRAWHTVFDDLKINEDREFGMGENIAWGHDSAEQVMYDEIGWMNSPGHRANILRPEYKYVAIGSAECVEQPGTYATVQLFWG